MRSCLLAVALMLSLPAVAKDTPQDPAQLVRTHGYVHIAFPKGGGDALVVSPVAGGKDVKIDTPAAVPPVANALAYGKWLPAGTYRITGWGALKWENGPQFEVKAGRATDIGDFTGVNVGGYQMVLVPIPHAENQSTYAAATKSFAAVLSDPAPISLSLSTVSPAMVMGQKGSGLGLIVDLMLAYDRKINKPSTQEAMKAAKDPAEFLRLARTLALPLQDEPARTSDGAMYFPADFGQLRKRAPDGQWSNVGIDTLRQILAVEEADGRLLAGSDDGHIRESLDDGATWHEVKALGGMQSIVDIDHAGNAWVVTTIEMFDDPDAPRGGGLVVAMKGAKSARLRVYKGSQPDLGDLMSSREFVLAPRDLVGWQGARGQLVDGYYHLTAGTSLQRLDVATGQWKTTTPNERISSLRVDPSSGVLTALWSQGAFSKVFVSSNRGDRWDQIGRPPYIIFDVQMDTQNSGWASRWNMGAFGGTWETYAFEPAKNDWNKSGEAPFNCKLMRVAKDVPVLCLAPDASILGLHAGKWEAEFSAM